MQGVLSSAKRQLVISSLVPSNELTIPAAALALASASAALARATAWYFLSPALWYIFSYSLFEISWRVGRARQFRLSDLRGSP